MDSFKYGDWNYKLENGNHEVDSPLEKTDSVFKYYRNTYYSQDAIKNQYLFCSHPYHLNDSMDCSELLWDFSNLSKGLYDKFYKQYEFEDHFEVDFEKEQKNGFQQIKFLFFNLITNNLGIISLTTEPLHTLMWAHYSTEKGFMVELDRKKLFDNLKENNNEINNYAFFPIQYVERLESIDFFSEDFGSPDVPFLYSAGIKVNDWCYENEWRFITYSKNYGIPNSILSPLPSVEGSNDRKVYYPKEAIKSITLGKQFFNGNNVEEILDSLVFKLKPGDDLDFVNYIIENLSDKIFWCGEYEKERNFRRSAERIEFEKLENNIFKVIRQKEGFYNK
ncbi:MAG: DUF2971 domain-containing protein [Salegentibacter mishustinae]|nr:DUF2971 domain-containing protein [Salegentibacter mishustinae]